MEKFLAILFIIYGIIMLGLIEHVISKKKEIYRTYIDPSSKKAKAGYSKYDGYWFSDDIGLDDLMRKNPEDVWLQKSGKNVIRCQIIFFSLFALILAIGIPSKVFGWI